MQKNKISTSLTIIIIASIMITGFTYYNFESIELSSLSKDIIVKGYEENTINGDTVITIDGEGFKQGDIIYVNKQEVNTAIGNDKYLSFLINKELYHKDSILKVQLKRKTPKGIIYLKSNEKTIKIIEAKEIIDDSIQIYEIGPSKIKRMETDYLIDNKVAISVIGRGYIKEDVIYINGEPLATTFGSETVLTCLLPRKFYTNIGNLDVQIKRKKDINVTNNIYVSNIKRIEVEHNDKIRNSVWENNKYVAHAMGMIDGKAYTNSYEAFLESYNNGARIFEVDLCFTRDKYLVARHDWTPELTKSFQQNLTLPKVMSLNEFKNEEIYGRYTPLSFLDICELMKKYPDIYIVTDTKEITEDEIKKQFEYIIEASNIVDPSIKNRIIPQIYNPDMYKIINNIYNWRDIIYTLYQSKQTPEEVVEFIKRNNIEAVTISEFSINQEFILNYSYNF